MKTNKLMTYSSPEFQTIIVLETSTVMTTSVTGNSSTEDLTEDTFVW